MTSKEIQCEIKRLASYSTAWRSAFPVNGFIIQKRSKRMRRLVKMYWALKKQELRRA